MLEKKEELHNQVYGANAKRLVLLRLDSQLLVQCVPVPSAYCTFDAIVQKIENNNNKKKNVPLEESPPPQPPNRNASADELRFTDESARSSTTEQNVWPMNN